MAYTRRGSRTCMARRCDGTTGADASVENGDMGLGNTNIWQWKDVFSLVGKVRKWGEKTRKSSQVESLNAI